MRITALFMLAAFMAGCASGSAVSHADGPAAVKPTAGPELCRDGTAPPCTPRS